MAEILYKYCLDENDELICIDGINEENRRAHEYKCISCGREMRVWLQGKGERSRQSHFGHKANCSCNSETYLHKLAKIRIKECFNKGDLRIYYRDYILCREGEHCNMFDPEFCHDRINEKYNLCKYFDTCEEEKGISGVVADLLLTNSKNPKIDPVLIEVYVKHKCSEDKINKGLKIFETKQIQSEQDIDDIVKTGIITNNPNTFVFERHGLGYNIAPSIRHKRDISRFVLFPTWGSKIVSVSCDKRDEVFDNTSLVEININYKKLIKKGYREELASSTKMIGLLFVAHRVPKYKNCILCKYFTSGYDFLSFCPLHKKFGTPQNPRESYGMRCNYFSIVELYRSINVEDLYECIELVKEEPIHID